MAVTTHHFKAVTCVKFTDEGSHFVSAGHDGMVVVWSLPYVLAQHTGEHYAQIQTDNPGPQYIFSDHSLPVADVYVGQGGMSARMASVSSDCTCKLYDLASGSLLLSLVFDSALSAVTMDITERQIFVGTVSGKIHLFNLSSPPHTREYHVSYEEKSVQFSDHSSSVTCLSVSLDGLRLLSGSNDHKVMLWNIPSQQCIRIIEHRGPVTNAFFTIVPKQVYSDKFHPSIILHSFKKSVELNSDEPYSIEVLTKQALTVKKHGNVHQMALVTQEAEEEEKSLQEQIQSLKNINAELYKFAVRKILQN